MKIITTIFSSVLTIVLIWVTFEPKEITHELVVKEVPVEIPVTVSEETPVITEKQQEKITDSVPVKTKVAPKIIRPVEPEIATTTKEIVEMATTTEEVKALPVDPKIEPKKITVDWHEEITMTPDKWVKDYYEVKIKFYPISSDGRLLNISKCYTESTNYLNYTVLQEAKYETPLNLGTLFKQDKVVIRCTTVNDEFTFRYNLW